MNKNSFPKLLIPSLTVFLSSACIMIIELVASRLIARHLGSSLYTWTSVIGVVLAGITIGNYLGGRIADKYKPQNALSTLFCLASIACVVIVILNNIVGEWMWLWKLSWPVRVFSHITLVFLLPSILLGTISPVVAKMALDRGLPAGRTVGDIYAFGAAGSIAGTFIAGFFLIAAMGTIAIIWTIAFFLLFLSISYRVKAWPVYLWAIILLIFFFLSSTEALAAQELGTTLLLREKSDSNILYEDETPYCWVAVKQVSKNPDIRMFLQDKLKHSEISMDDITDLQYFYTKIFAALTVHATDKVDRPSFLVIGGGGYAFPQFLKKSYPSSHVDVAEIDPGVTEAAHAAFGLPRDTSINSINLDARNHIDDVLRKKNISDSTFKYDVIFEDAINDYCVPFQLVTKEFNEKIKDVLSDNGLYLVNLIDTYDNAQFLGAVVNTTKETFPYVYVLTSMEKFSELRETYVVAASLRPLEPEKIVKNYDRLMRARIFNDNDYSYINQKAKNILLTDDYAPVENLLSPVVRQSGKEFLAAKYLKMARELKADGELIDSIEYFEKAMATNPSMTILTCNEIALSYVALQRPQEAVKAFQKAISHYYNIEPNDKNIGSIHMNLGILYAQLQKNTQAKEQFDLAIERFKEETTEQPHNHLAFSRLGDIYAMTKNFKDATKCFKLALDLSPDNHSYYGKLIRALEIQGKFEEAIYYIQQQIQIMEKQGNEKAVQQLKQYLYNMESKIPSSNS